MIETLLILLKVILCVASALIGIATLCYIIGLAKFMYDAIKEKDRKTFNFGALLLLAFLLISIPSNWVMFHIAW